MGIRASGEDIEEAFEEAAKGMFSIITNVSKVEEGKEYEIEIKEDSMESLLVNFLSELIYLHEVNNLLFSDFEIEIKEEGKSKKLVATAFGEKIDLEKHEMDTAVKAVSYHDLSVDPDGTIEILLDI